MPEPPQPLGRNDPSTLLHEAIRLIHDGERARAREALNRLLKVDPQNADAWRWLATCVETLEERCYCLGRQLALEPDNAALRRAYERLAHAVQEKQASVEQAAGVGESPFPAQERNAADDIPTKPVRLRPGAQKVIRGQTAPAAQIEAGKPSKSADAGPWRYPSNSPLIIGGGLVIVILFLAAAGPYLAPMDPLLQHYIAKLPQGFQRPPFPAFVIPDYPLGSDEFGRDILSRLLWSIRPTLLIVFFVAAVRLIAGILFGLLAGWSVGQARRVLDALIGWALAIPVLFVALFVIAATEQNWGVWAFILGLSITGWAEVARVVREQTRLIKGQSYIESARALGASDAQILGLHILPQIMPLVWVLLSIEVGSALMVVAGLGFIGYFVNAIWLPLGDWTGIRASGLPELGQMVSTVGEFQQQPWGVLSAGTIIFLTVLGFNLFGEGLRRVMSPEARQRESRVNQVLDATGGWLSDQFYTSTSIWRKVNPTLAAAAGLAAILLGGGAWIIHSQAADRPVSALPIPAGNLWVDAARDAQGTYWTDQPGIIRPEAAWKFNTPDGFTGGPVVAADGRVIAVSTTGMVYAIAPDGAKLWQTAIGQTPAQTPALGASGNIYVVDQQSGLTAIDPAGKRLWRYTPPYSEPSRLLQVISAPIAGPDEVLYYANEQYVMAVDAQGRQRWLIEIPTFSITNPQLRLTPDGKLLILDDTIEDAQSGKVRFSHTTEPMDSYIIGANGSVYRRTPDQFLVSSFIQGGMALSPAGTWDTRLLGTSFRFPHDAGITPHGRKWLLYASGYEYAKMIWLDEAGEMMSPVDYPYRTMVLVGFDQEDVVYICGFVEAETPHGECRANPPGSSAPVWKFDLGGGTPQGGALASGRLYVTTSEGFIYALADPGQK